MFTSAGLTSANAADPRLRAAIRGERTLVGSPILRIAFEGVYDLRREPPRLPIDVVFDIAPGAVVTDIVAETRTITIAPERVMLGVTLVYDGRRWLADFVGHPSEGSVQGYTLPTPLPAGEPCTGFRRDPAGPPFDDDAGFTVENISVSDARVWCDANGRGRVVRQPDQIVMDTRYPCDQGRIARISLGDPLGMPIDSLDLHEYLRDPRGQALESQWIAERWRPDVDLPEDAASTGWTNGNVELYMSPSRYQRGIYVRLDGRFEWWPRADPTGWGVIDCN